jgi:putative beta-barrel porin BBP2
MLRWLLAVILLCGIRTLSAQAIEPQVEIFSQEGPATSADSAENPISRPVPVVISLSGHVGYDDNSRTTSDDEGRFFTSEEVTLSYDRTRPGTQIKLITAAGLVERFGQGTDVNAYLDLSVAHQVTPRLTLSGTVDTAYRNEPDFGENVGPDQRVGNYFKSDDGISAAYQWTRRFATVSSYSLRLVRYEDSFVASFTDREEHTLGEEFRFDLSRATILVADYQFLAVNYDSFPRDSITHFLLLGVEQTLTRRLKAQARVGASYRSFEGEESRTDPTFEGTLDYAINSLSSLSWSMRYSVEEPVVREALSRTTFRTGVQLRYGFTRRISGVLGLNYHHDETKEGLTAATSGPAFSTDALQIVLGLRYQITRHLDWDISYEHSETDSSAAISGYSRNRYSTGLSFTF